jgi:hypothetical protein
MISVPIKKKLTGLQTALLFKDSRATALSELEFSFDGFSRVPHYIRIAPFE